jgi:hypothetical protein
MQDCQKIPCKEKILDHSHHLPVFRVVHFLAAPVQIVEKEVGKNAGLAWNLKLQSHEKQVGIHYSSAILNFELLELGTAPGLSVPEQEVHLCTTEVSLG